MYKYQSYAIETLMQHALESEMLRFTQSTDRWEL